jgi:hypothetical protein
VLEPYQLDLGPFASIGLNYVLHCLPGDLVEKAVVSDNLKPFLAPGGGVFGASLLSEGVERSRAARTLMRISNKTGFITCFLPSGPNIHQMCNESDGETVSLHIYGFNHRMHGSLTHREYRAVSASNRND